jgi:diadenosine tetraphosphate (Ap4A) HIT family hydrolase
MMDCIFCQPDRSVLAQTKLSLAFLDGFPVSRGHTLVAPRRHVGSIWEMTTEEYVDAFNLVRQIDAFNLVRQIKDILQNEFEPRDLTLAQTVAKRPGNPCFTPTFT